MYLDREDNEHGTGTSRHVCDTCGTKFTLTPEVAPDAVGWENCMGEDCPSYDASRDCEVLFMSDDEIAREKKVVDIKFLRQRKPLAPEREGE